MQRQQQSYVNNILCIKRTSGIHIYIQNLRSVWQYNWSKAVRGLVSRASWGLTNIAAILRLWSWVGPAPAPPRQIASSRGTKSFSQVSRLAFCRRAELWGHKPSPQSQRRNHAIASRWCPGAETVRALRRWSQHCEREPTCGLQGPREKEMRIPQVSESQASECGELSEERIHNLIQCLGKKPQTQQLLWNVCLLLIFLHPANRSGICFVFAKCSTSQLLNSKSK